MSSSPIDSARPTTELEKALNEGFDGLLQDETFRFLASKIPECPDPDVFLTLLKTVYRAGFSNGESTTIMLVAIKVLKDAKKSSNDPSM
jgi:hypothetical protein